MNSFEQWEGKEKQNPGPPPLNLRCGCAVCSGLMMALVNAGSEANKYTRADLAAAAASKRELLAGR